MPMVSNTSPLLNLAIIGQLELLQQQFNLVLIPEAVLSELQIDSNLPGSKQLKAAIDANWIVVQPITNNHTANSLALDLDKGESEAIALALQLNETAILLDESDARLAAKLLQLQPIGVLGILLRAKRLNTIKKLKPLLLQLQDEAGFYIHPSLFNQVLQNAGEA